MFINVTQKARPLFSALPAVADKDQGHTAAAAAPLWSWHASYFTHQRKKQLADLITEGIRRVFAAVGVDAASYLAQAGEIRVNTTYSRAINGVVQNRIFLLEHGVDVDPDDGEWADPISIQYSRWGSETPYISAKKALPTWPVEALKAAAANGFQS